MGSISGGYMVLAGHPVTLVDGWHQNVAAIRKHGLRIVSSERTATVRPRALHLDELSLLDDPFDLIFLAVKSYDTEWMVRAVAPYLAPDGAIVSVQNGINEDRIGAIVGRGRTVGCVAHLAGSMFEPGVVTRYSGEDWLTYTIGELDGAMSERLNQIHDLLACVGPTTMTGTIYSALWSKLTLNSMVNGLTGITGYPSPHLWQDSRGFNAMVAIGGEAVRVSHAEGVAPDPIEPTGAHQGIPSPTLAAAAGGDGLARAAVRDVLAAVTASRSGRRENVSSLLQDIRKSRRTEIDYLNGEIVARGARHGIDTHTNRLIVEMVHAAEEGSLERNPDVLDTIIDRMVDMDLASS